MTKPNPWIRCIKPRPDARIRLYCIPHAGGGASAYRTWQDGLPSIVEVRAVQLPGRENRLMETPFSSATEAAKALADVVEPELSGTWALFGHSMGALVGYELLRELARRGATLPGRFFASAFRAPQVANPDEPIHELPDAEFLDELNRRYDAVPAAARESEELLELILPGLRADTTVCDVYRHEGGEPLSVPISALGGERDTIVRPELLEAWADRTSAGFDLTLFPGDHFYLQADEKALLELISKRLLELAS